MSVSKELKKIEDLYTGNLKAQGTVSTAVGWNSPESQQLRFEKLTTVIEDRTSPVSINDYGCGYGAHLEYVIKQCGIQVAAYHGYDLSESMLAAAKENLGFFKGELDLRRAKDIATTADFSFVSGTFNVRFDSTYEDWRAFIEAKLAQIDAHSTRGFAFNLLSSYVDWQDPHLFYGDPSYWFDLCKRKYSKCVALLHDYPLHEWTIVVRKHVT